MGTPNAMNRHKTLEKYNLKAITDGKTRGESPTRRWEQGIKKDWPREGKGEAKNKFVGIRFQKRIIWKWQANLKNG